MNELVTKDSFDLEATSFEQAMKYAEFIAKSSLVPKDYKDKPADVLIAIQMGKELGLKPLQSLQNIATINGRPCIWGDAMLAIVKSHPDLEYIKEYMESDTAYCVVKRRNQPEHLSKFSTQDAKKAGLCEKSGTWQQYPNRMLQMRARGFALRDTFADALKGIITREEAQDYPSVTVINPDSTKAASIKDLIQKNQDSVVNSSEPPTYTFEELKKQLSDAATLIDLSAVAARIKLYFKGTPHQIAGLRHYYEIRADELKKSD